MSYLTDTLHEKPPLPVQEMALDGFPFGFIIQRLNIELEIECPLRLSPV
jgi:hypothetical protein